ncbi:MAG: glycerol-3-phosphate 1-O-acyltransferase PlsY [Deltaproteobacteria bacterium]|nr:glycerol-3-phosphate 1-O-acyltransferase PlsY [Deltaproteobacteria bacterium]
MSGVDAALILGAYLLGAIPFGLVLGKALGGVDVRAAGSGNIGATNVARTAGKKIGALVLLLDALKALLPVLLAKKLFPDDVVLHAAVGAAAVLGHVFPIYLKFRGGKGVASAMGALLGLAPLATLGALVLFGIVYAATRLVSLGSLLGAALTVVLTFALGYPRPYAYCALGIALLIVVRHQGNIARMLRGNENKL